VNQPPVKGKKKIKLQYEREHEQEAVNEYLEDF